MTVKLAINGATGRMGREILKLAVADESFDVVQLWSREDETLWIDGKSYSSTKSREGEPAVIIDFSSPEGTKECLDKAVELGIPVVCGTTGFLSVHEKVIRFAAESIPIVKSANMSLGINLLKVLVAEAATALGLDFNIDIIEMHHKAKKDMPSGTALLLKQALPKVPSSRTKPVPVDDSTLVSAADVLSHDTTKVDRHVEIHSVRAGTIVGEHHVIFAGPSERVELVHRAESREIFARGALKAAAWIVSKEPGLYTMKQVLGLE
ncbi:MAG: 4-hydroxy-tetrahydrodipicolinate reductase [Planctomycetes bacterium]|nr:4-hydroxy-tetrahydrodipicolinate reductase [Planctomycetota bacterium]